MLRSDWEQRGRATGESPFGNAKPIPVALWVLARPQHGHNVPCATVPAQQGVNTLGSILTHQSRRSGTPACLDGGVTRLMLKTSRKLLENLVLAQRKTTPLLPK